MPHHRKSPKIGNAQTWIDPPLQFAGGPLHHKFRGTTTEGKYFLTTPVWRVPGHALTTRPVHDKFSGTTTGKDIS
ncbi:hypothetical protein RRG08_053916 [Elysia crispata]|uniref:Uncharacterized protein n=1 Tax=Elysia crispata TaxID=231223 RepID=A0AAE1DQ81_9GAST|nr:hypothetical protein RRG08_053916 [Elysia crispata]